MTSLAALPNPGETLVIEASAGTGKTWTMSTLATRFVAERGIEISQIAIVTFSVAATAEVKSRTRARFQQCADALASPTPPLDSNDSGLIQLWSPDPKIRDLHRARLCQGLDDFDLACIMTTHGFCDRLLAWLGILADHDPSDHLIPDLSELGSQVCADHYLRLSQHMVPAFSFDQALTWTRQGLQAPDARITPAGSEEAEFVTAVKENVEQVKRRAGQYTFDDMLLRCRDGLVHPITGAQARARVSQRYPVVLVDEFQDTDSLQWQIIESGFVGASTVVLIGDPKQSIYGFRGADVGAYLKATDNLTVETLNTNYRSSESIIEAVSNLMDQAQLGDPRIQVKPVQASPQAPRLISQRQADFRIRVPKDIRPRRVQEARALIDQDLISDLIDLIDQSPTYQENPMSKPRSIRPDDIAIIVATNDRGNQLMSRLRQSDIPATFTGTKSVFGSQAAQDWMTFLRTLESGSSTRIRAASLTSLIGWDLERLVNATPEEFASLVTLMRRLSALNTAKGPLVVFEWLLDHSDITTRLRTDLDGERTLADLTHIATVISRNHPALMSPVDWLAKRVAATSQLEETMLKAPRNSQAIQIMTIHQAKGLQFPIVYLPQLADRFVSTPTTKKPTVFHYLGERVFDLGISKGKLTQSEADVEEAAESLRTCYVGLTRATTAITTWWVPTHHNTASSPLHRLLFRNGEVPPASISLAGRYPHQLDIPGIAIETITDPPTRPIDLTVSARRVFFEESKAPIRSHPSLSRVINTSWRRTSFSALTAASHLESVSFDERTPNLNDMSDDDIELDQLSPMANLPGGTSFGSLVHAVFEHADPATTDLTTLVYQKMHLAGITGFSAEELAQAMAPGLMTPLGEIANGLSLAEIAPSDRLAELSFELTLASSGHPTSLSQVAQLLDRHLLPDDPLVEYGSVLTSPEVDHRVLQGYLIGSIDAVLRVDNRYLIVDYKTNRLGPPESELRLRHYTLPVMAQAMMASHYPLQALLYSVGLHRFLRWRLPNYDPSRHLGGIAYLFVRGMAGPNTPVRDGTVCGVFNWRPPTQLIEDLSDLLSGVEK